MKQRTVVPQYVIGLKSIPDLNYIEYDKSVGLKIGGLATLAQVAESPVVLERFPLLNEAISQMASVQVRNIGTVAGNLCTASPSADTAPSLLVMGAKVKLVKAKGKERVVPLEEFFLGPGETVLGVGEILVEVQVPDLPPKSGATYLKLSQRRAMDLAMVGVGCLLTVDGGKCKDVRIALGAVAPTPIRAKDAEALLEGKALEDELLEKAAAAAMKAAKPITDIRASADYRLNMVGVLTKRAVRQAWERASKAK
jgi:carbon-monoxide dehydrogenase medium subunit